MADDPAPASDVADPVEGAPPPADRIDQFLQERLTRLTANLPASDLPLDRGLAEEIEALQGLSSLRDRHFPRPAAHRAPVVPVLLAVTAIIVTLAVFVRVPSIAVELEIDSSAVSFRTVGQVVLTESPRLHKLVARSFAPTEIEEPLDLRVVRLTPPLEVRPGSNGVITLRPIGVPAGAQVTIQTAGDESWQIDISHLGLQDRIAANLSGTIAMSASGMAQEIDFSRGVRLELMATPASPPETPRLGLDVRPQSIASFFSERTINIDRLSFEESGYETPGDFGAARYYASSVLAGSVLNQSVGGRKTTVRPRTKVDLDVVGGQITGLRLDRPALHVTAVVRAREVMVGFSDSMTTLRPSWLEWLAHHHTLQLVWGSAAWLLALLIGGIRWWRKPDIQ